MKKMIVTLGKILRNEPVSPGEGHLFIVIVFALAAIMVLVLNLLFA